MVVVVLGTNRASNAGRKIVIVWVVAEHHYTFHTCIVRTINPNTEENHTITNYVVIALIAINKWMGVALETKFVLNIYHRRQWLHAVVSNDFMVGVV